MIGLLKNYSRLAEIHTVICFNQRDPGFPGLIIEVLKKDVIAFILPNDKRVGIKSALWRHEPSDLERPIPRYKVSSFVLDDADRPIIFSDRRFAEHVIVMLCQDVLGQPWEVPQHLKIRGSLINRGLARCVFEKYSF